MALHSSGSGLIVKKKKYIKFVDVGSKPKYLVDKILGLKILISKINGKFLFFKKLCISWMLVAIHLKI